MSKKAKSSVFIKNINFHFHSTPVDETVDESLSEALSSLEELLKHTLEKRKVSLQQLCVEAEKIVEKLSSIEKPTNIQSDKLQRWEGILADLKYLATLPPEEQ